MLQQSNRHQLAIEVGEPSSETPDPNIQGGNPPSPLSEDDDTSHPTPVAAADGVDNSTSSSSSSPSPPPLYQSSRLKGYITLLISAVYNYIAAASISGRIGEAVNWCLYTDDLGRFAVQDLRSHNESRIKYAKSSAMITEIVTGFIIAVHLDVFTGLGNKVWDKMFGPHSKVELFVLSFLTIMWMLTTWFNTTIRGVAGDGKDQFNLYFSTWICCWASFWTLERWCVTSGRASFERFVRSWPNRGPAWIILFIFSLSDFLFALDLYRNWYDGTKYYPYVANMYSRVKKTEWVLLLFVSSFTFVVSFAWALAEIFRENRTNKGGIKSDTETYVEGLLIHLVTIIWVITVCIVTMPDGAASLLGNAYFTTWGTTFAAVGTLVWWLRDWRQGIFEVIQKQQDEYEMAKMSVRKREERKIAQRLQDAHVGESAQTDAAVVDGVASRWFECISPRLGTVPEGAMRHADGDTTEHADNYSQPAPDHSGNNVVVGLSDEDVTAGNENGTMGDDTTTSDLSPTEYARPRLGTGSSSVTTTTTSPESGVVCSSRSLYVSARSSMPDDYLDGSLTNNS